MISSLGYSNIDQLKSFVDKPQDQLTAGESTKVSELGGKEMPANGKEVHFSADSMKVLDLENKLSELVSKPVLNAQQQQQVDQLNKEIDKIMTAGAKQWSNADLKSMADSYAAIDKISSGGSLSDQDLSKLNALEKRLDEIFNKYVPSPLSPEQENKLTTLFEQLDKIYDQSTANPASLLKLEDFMQMADGVEMMAQDPSGELSNKGRDIFNTLNSQLSQIKPEALDTKTTKPMGNEISEQRLNKNEQTLGRLGDNVRAMLSGDQRIK